MRILSEQRDQVGHVYLSHPYRAIETRAVFEGRQSKLVLLPRQSGGAFSGSLGYTDVEMVGATRDAVSTSGISVEFHKP